MTIVAIGLAGTLTVLMLYTDIMAKLWRDGSFVIRYNLIRNGWQHLKSSNYLGVGAGNTIWRISIIISLVDGDVGGVWCTILFTVWCLSCAGVPECLSLKYQI